MPMKTAECEVSAFHTKRRFLILFREDIRQTPAGQEYHKFRHHIGSDTHVGNQCQIHSRKDRNGAHQEKTIRRIAGTPFLFSSAVFPAASPVCGSLQSSCHPAQGSVQGGKQRKYGTTEHENRYSQVGKSPVRQASDSEMRPFRPEARRLPRYRSARRIQQRYSWKAR